MQTFRKFLCVVALGFAVTYASHLFGKDGDALAWAIAALSIAMLIPAEKAAASA